MVMSLTVHVAGLDAPQIIPVGIALEDHAKP